MKITSVMMSTIAAAGLLAGGISLVQAGPDRVRQHADPHATPAQTYRHGGQLHPMLRHLDLEQAQRDTISGILQQHRAALKPQREALRDIHRQLRQAVRNQSRDEETIQQLAQQKAGLTAEMTIKRIAMMQEIYQQLTPEQQQQLEQWRERRDHHQG